MSIEFGYDLGEPGHASASLEVGGEVIEFELNNVCNPLGDLLGALETLVSNPTHLWGETNAAAFVWYCDNESYNFQLSLGGHDRLSLRVTQTCEFFGDDEVEVLSSTCLFRELLGAVVRRLDVFIKGVGLLNYHQRWQTDEFPVTSFLFLKKWLLENAPEVYLGEGGGSTLGAEVELLLR